jgi:hypothetical protein
VSILYIKKENICVHSLARFCHDAPEKRAEKVLVVVGEDVDTVWGREAEIKKPAGEVTAVAEDEVLESGKIVKYERACYPRAT